MDLHACRQDKLSAVLRDHDLEEYQRITELKNASRGQDGFRPRNPFQLQFLTDNSARQRWWFPKQYVSPYAEYWPFREAGTLAFLQSLRDRYHHLLDQRRWPYVVIKKGHGSSHGEGVTILPLSGSDDILARLREQNFSYLEGFVPSMPIYTSESSDARAGCMRYFVDFLVDDCKRRYQTIFETAYWRVAPVPHSAEAEIGSKCIVNLARGAIPQPVKERHLHEARAVIDETMTYLLQMCSEVFYPDTEEELEFQLSKSVT